MDKLPICCGQGIAPYCPSCGSGEYLHNEDGNENNFCGQCGCPLDWSEMYNEDAERIEEKFKCGDCAEYCRSANKETQGVCKAKGVHVRRSKPACKKHFRKAMHIWGEKEHGTGGRTMSRIIQYTADDEEPECRNCDNQDGQKVCENCGPEYGWAGYIRSDLEIDENE